jgi:hypothetical protein
MNPFNINKEFGEKEGDIQSHIVNHLKPLDLEFKLCKLVKFLRIQGYPIDNSFVSYYSIDFQVQINCGPDPISKAVVLNPSDLEIN